MTTTVNGHAEIHVVADRVLSLFRGRADRVAVSNGADFKPEVLDAPITAERLVKDHFQKRACLGFYLMTVDNQVWCSCADLDNKPDKPDPDWREKAKKAADYLNGAGLSPLVEISQSGNAAHVWVFFSEPVDAWIVRAFWREVGKRIGVKFVEIYPRQDYLTEGGIGNLVRYPFWGQSHFVDPADWSALEPIEAMDGVKPVSADDFLSICRHLRFKLEKPAPSSTIELTGEISGGDLSPRVVELVNKPGKLKDRWAGNVEGLRDPSRSGLIESIATLLVRFYVPTGEIVSALRHYCQSIGYEKGLRPDWIPRTVEHAYAFAAGKAMNADETQQAVRFKVYTSAELDELDFSNQPIIQIAKIEGQPGGVFGGTKTLKTCIVADAGFSVATGTNFLNCGLFPVPRPRRVMFMSAESGLKALQRLARRIAASRGYELSEVENLMWCPAVPFIGNDRDSAELRSRLKDNGVEWVVFDPLYMMLDGREANNLYAQGAQFRRLQEVCREAETDFDLLHHTSRASARVYDPPTLNDAQWSGIAEFVGQWWLLGRRERYQEGSGIHRLWFGPGARGDFQSLWALDVNEHADASGRPQGWSVTVRPASETQAAVEDERSAQEDRRLAAEKVRFEKRLETDKAKVVKALGKRPGGETKNQIRALANISSDARTVAAIASLLEEGQIEEADVFKSGKKTPHPGFKLRLES